MTPKEALNILIDNLDQSRLKELSSSDNYWTKYEEVSEAINVLEKGLSMSKELLDNVSTQQIAIDLFNIVSNGKYNMNDLVYYFDRIDKALTPPTVDDVCKALSEYLGYEVEAWNEYEKMCFKSVYTSPFQKISKNYTTIIWLYGNAVTFEDELRLPPHLITMIGKFYESLEEEND